jgi:hypothetical protein
MSANELPASAKLKLDLMFEGVRYSEALSHAAEHSFPNYFPYRFDPDEHDPIGMGRAHIPYMLVTPDDTHICLRAHRASPWSVSGSQEEGYELRRDEGGEALAIDFEPVQQWMTGRTSDDLPRAQAGLSLHGDMIVINIAPACEYFLVSKQDDRWMNCSFCRYGAPTRRTRELGQVMGQTAIPELLYRRMQEVLEAAFDETPIRHIYLVGGSLTDPREEGIRYAELARRVQEVNRHRAPVTCGSGALPEESLELLHGEGLVDAVSFNLEVWSQPLFERVCPGKHRFVGYHRWIASLEKALELWGQGRVYTAMVAGVEIEPDIGLSVHEAAEIALRGAEDLCSRGIVPTYSLYWPRPGRDYPEHLQNLRSYFTRLQLGYHEIRRARGIELWEGFMCHRCAYMQIECDIERGLAADEAAE